MEITKQEQEKEMNPQVSYTFKYQSDENSIDLNTLLLSQIHFSTILNELKNEVAPDIDLSIKIRPLEKGSVPFDIILNVSWIEGIFNAHQTIVHCIELGSAIVGGLVSLIQLKIWLKGEKPTNVITNNNNTVTIIQNNIQINVTKEVYDIYTSNSTVDRSMKKAFEAIESDEQVTGIEILNEQKQSLVAVAREDFDNLSMDNTFLEEVTEVSNISNQALTLLKVVFDKGYKWQFYLESRKINASIKDADFMDRVTNGEQFAKGDVLIVDLEIRKVLDKSIDIYIEKDFSITKVNKHIARAQQARLDFKTPTNDSEEE